MALTTGHTSRSTPYQLRWGTWGSLGTSNSPSQRTGTYQAQWSAAIALTPHWSAVATVPHTWQSTNEAKTRSLDPSLGIGLQHPWSPSLHVAYWAEAIAPGVAHNLSTQPNPWTRLTTNLIHTLAPRHRVTWTLGVEGAPRGNAGLRINYGATWTPLFTSEARPALGFNVQLFAQTHLRSPTQPIANLPREGSTTLQVAPTIRRFLNSNWSIEGGPLIPVTATRNYDVAAQLWLNYVR